MGSEFIPNVGNIDLPDDLTDEEKAEAVNSHPLVQQYLQNKNKNGLGQKIDQLLTNTFGPLNNYIKNNPILNGADQFSHQIGKGIPAAGNFIPDTEEQEQFAKNNPITSAIAHGIGNAITLGPISDAILAKTAAEAPATIELGEQTAPKTFEGILKSPVKSTISPGIKNLIGQSALFGGSAGADALSRGENLEDASKEAGLSALGGGVGGTVASKLLSPGINMPDWLSKTIATGGSAIAGLSHGGILEALLGATIGKDTLPLLLQKLVGNKVFQNPENKSILNALTAQGAQKIQEPQSPLVPNGD